MENNSQKISRSQKLVGAVAGVLLLSICSPGECLAEESAAAESDNIMNKVRGVQAATEPNISKPEVYKQPPKIVEQIVGGQTEFKLFYFCRYHTSDELKTVINDQFASVLFDEKGKSARVHDFTVTSNPATNQLIVRCPGREDVEAVLQTLEYADVPPVQVKIDCVISEIYADRTLDWQTSIMIQELFGEGLWAGPAGQPFGSSVTQLLEEVYTSGAPPAFPGASLRELARAKMGLQMGYVNDKFLSLVDILESQGYLKILMNPTLEVVNGKMAKVSSTQNVPLQQTYLTNPLQNWYETRMEYKDVVDSLQITPHVFADDYIGLETDIVLGSKLTPEGVKQLPIITTKEINNKENRIRQGQSLVIGGIRKTEKRDVLRGVPFLKDIPLIGILFSGRDFEERVVETMFILTPTISTGGMPKKEMVEEVTRKHESPESGGLTDTITDPFGTKGRKEEQQRRVHEADQSRLAAERGRTEARSALREANRKVKEAEGEAEKAKVELEKVKAEAQEAVTNAEKAKADADAKAKAAEAAIAEAEKAKKEADQAKAEAQKAGAEAPKQGAG
jgi:Flp pilus assembly secretin CpaC